MNITYKIDSSQGVIIEKWYGSVDVEDVAALWKLKLADKNVLACRGTLADLRDCQLQFSGDELRCKIRTILFPSVGARKIKTAILVSEPLQYGVARQFLAYSDEIGDGQVFTNEIAAYKWLLE
jgi:hypothetical protein